MSDDGMSIQSHTHRYLDTLNEKEIKKELELSKKIIEKITGKPVDFLAIPGGWYNKKVLKIAEKIGYKAICTSDIGTNSLKDKKFILKRIDVPEDISIEQFSKLFSPSKIATDHTLRQLRLIVRRIIGRKMYKVLCRFYHKYKYKKNSLVNF